MHWYENQHSKNLVLHLRMNLLQFIGTSIYLIFFCVCVFFCFFVFVCLFIKETCMCNLMLSPFSYLKDLIFRNGYKTKTKPYFLWSLLFQNMKLQKCITREPWRKGLYFQCQAFLQSVTFTLSTQRLWIFYCTGFI